MKLRSLVVFSKIKRKHLLLSAFVLVLIVNFLLISVFSYKIFQANELADFNNKKMISIKPKTKDSLKSTIETLQKELEESKTRFQNLHERFSKTQETFFNETTQNSLSFTLNLQNYVQNENEFARKKQINLPEKFMFSFSSFVEHPPLKEEIKTLSKQQKIIQFLTNKLFLSTPTPKAILSIQREPASKNENELDIFSINQYVSIRSSFPNLKTLAFSMQFLSKTETFRNFLNAIACAPIFLIVRDITIEPDSSFQNYRKFSLVLEFIDIKSVNFNDSQEIQSLSKIENTIWKTSELSLFDNKKANCETEKAILPFVFKGIQNKPYKLQFKGAFKLPDGNHAVLVSHENKEVLQLFLNKKNVFANIVLIDFKEGNPSYARVFDENEKLFFDLFQNKITFYENRFLINFQSINEPEKKISIDDKSKTFEFGKQKFSILKFEKETQTVSIESHDKKLVYNFNL